MNIGYIILGLILLVFGGNWLLKASVSMSLRLHIPKIVIGLTVVSFATSAPELIVSIQSALEGFPDLALGNVVGSNIANLGLVLGITVLLAHIGVEKGFYKSDWPMMMIASVLLYYFLVQDGVLEFYEGAILFFMLVAFLVYLLRFKKQAPEEEPIENDVILSGSKTVLFVVLGAFGLWAGSELLIKGAVSLAEDFGVSERVIGITIVSVGTSIPELAASIIAVIKKEKAISLGNLVGSNIFNILGVLGITAMITPIKVKDMTLLNSDIFWMLGIAFLILPMVFFSKKRQLNWKNGIILLAIYLFFIWQTIQ